MLAAESAIFRELDAIRIVLLVLESVVVPLLALGACQCYLNAHFLSLPNNNRIAARHILK